MSGTTLSVLLVTHDLDVKLVAASLQQDGITSRTVSGARDLHRALASAKGQNVVAVFDGDITSHPSFPIDDIYERLRELPLLVLMSTEAEHGLAADAQRATAEEFARKPITPSVPTLCSGPSGSRSPAAW
jgi:CheY-like chemotaxis protein